MAQLSHRIRARTQTALALRRVAQILLWPVSQDKLKLLKNSFTEDAMSPGQAADKVGVTYATAKRVLRQVGSRYQSRARKETCAELGRIHQTAAQETKAKLIPGCGAGRGV